MIVELGALPAVGERVSIELPVDPAELVSEMPMRRWLEADVLEVERHVPTRIRISLKEAAMTEEAQ